MRRLVFLDSARDDLKQIFAYITRETENQNIGRGFVKALRQQCVKPATLPASLEASPRAELNQALRSWRAAREIVSAFESAARRW